ncbi:heme ABC transporter ATP-binding protein [Rhodococcus sp. 06-1059B-a]|nr:heme ABC transporter ATP-binding protein [Rhodococcus sp. 06-1059B-a]OZD60240.1 heme ABC transporter ATP-binding protein [Rhodococcus sp. 06-1059B-a]
MGMTLFRRNRDLPDDVTAGTVTMSTAGVTAVRSGREVLRGVDIDVVAGEVLSLVGPNGAGKSTLLAVLTGELRPAAGSVELHGRPLTRWSDLDAARRRSVLPQQHTVGFSFTAHQVVRMGRAPWAGTDEAENDDAAVALAMKHCDVTEFADRPFAGLSGGERARVSLARVLAQRTSTLLLDEPTAALDIGHQETVMSVARDRARRGDAVVVVLHDLALAAAYSDRIAILDRGALVAVGSPRSTLNEELLTRVYGHRVEVFDHPRTGGLLVLPVRGDRAKGSQRAGF